MPKQYPGYKKIFVEYVHEMLEEQYDWDMYFGHYAEIYFRYYMKETDITKANPEAELAGLLVNRTWSKM